MRRMSEAGAAGLQQLGAAPLGPLGLMQQQRVQPQAAPPAAAGAGSAPLLLAARLPMQASDGSYQLQQQVRSRSPCVALAGGAQQASGRATTPLAPIGRSTGGSGGSAGLGSSVGGALPPLQTPQTSAALKQGAQLLGLLPSLQDGPGTGPSSSAAQARRAPPLAGTLTPSPAGSLDAGPSSLLQVGSLR
jgi:hypothetical protein